MDKYGGKTMPYNNKWLPMTKERGKERDMDNNKNHEQRSLRSHLTKIANKKNEGITKATDEVH